MNWIILTYGIVLAILIYPVAQSLHDPDEDNFMDIAVAVVLGGIVSLFWPVWLTFYLLYRLSKYLWSKVKTEEEKDVRRGSC
jgi:type VI protein secretion system component VasK